MVHEYAYISYEDISILANFASGPDGHLAPSYTISRLGPRFMSVGSKHMHT